MTPTPQEHLIRDQKIGKESVDLPIGGEEVVISGISGIFPKSDNVQEFMENLYNKVDMVTVSEINKNIKHLELPKYVGQVKGLDKFDGQFFKVAYWQSEHMDPLCKKLMEHTYTAIYDSGINPLSLIGTKLGVFVGSSFADATTISLYDVLAISGLSLPGCSKTMLANRISYWINAKGPSYTLDLDCVSSMVCLENAFRSIKSGECEAAIVAGCNSCTHPVLSVNLKRAGFLCTDRRTKCFDKNSNGYVRAEAVSVLFLQRAKNAKRIYAEISHVIGNYSKTLKSKFPHVRNAKDLQIFFENFYGDLKISPDDVEYLEASASGMAEADKNELEAIGQVFGKRRPLKIGCVKSNMGNSEPASGVCALTKLCLAYHTGILPGNLHYSDPHNIKELGDGTLRVLTENDHFNRGYTAINNFSFFGANYHVLLKGQYRQKEKDRYKCQIPYLVLASGRHEKAVNTIFEILKSNPVDAEQIALLHNIYKVNTPGHTGRGYTVLETKNDETISLTENFEYYSGQVPQVWFLYSGMGSQWPGMGADLMRIPIFAKSIQRCHRVLEPLGVDLIKIITDRNKDIFDNILNCFVGIAAIQIGLTDLLKEIGLLSDNIIGHSVGELGCAYADGCLTAEEMILAAYYRGLVSSETKFIKGLMAAVGLCYKDIKALCPPEIEVACHNSFDSSTVSGPADAISEFVHQLSIQGIFAKEVPTANIAYHSRYVAKAGPKLLAYLKKVIVSPKLRSVKWLCTSVPEGAWETAKYASAEYFTNNLLNSVYFEETARMIPSNALVIEIAPHGLLQAILKRSHPNCMHIPITRRQDKDPVTFLLTAMGKTYQAGLTLKVDALYPKVEFPVSTETPLLSHLVEWEHSEKWKPFIFKDSISCYTSARSLIVSVHDDEFKYMKGNVRNDVNYFPEAALLVFVWETFAMSKGKHYKELTVAFEDIKFYEEIVLKPEGLVRLSVQIQKGKHYFEVTNDTKKVMSGIIKDLSLLKSDNFANQDSKEETHQEVYMNQNNIYKLMENKGYAYRDKFRTIISSNLSYTNAHIKWSNDWTVFLQALIQFNILSNGHSGVSVTKYINKLTINVKKHKDSDTLVIDDNICHNAERDDNMRITRCGGVVIDSIVFDKRTKSMEPTLIRRTLVPHFESQVLNDQWEDYDFGKIKNYKLFSSNPGELESLFWSEIHSPQSKIIKVLFAGISMKDCSKAESRYFENADDFGMDFSGVDEKNQKLMGVVKYSALSNIISCDSDLVWPVPEHWSMEEAATVPLPYIQAYYCLTIKGNLRRGQTVLVTGGAGALGQAVISLCLALECTVYTTVGNDEKKRFLLKLFPQLSENHIDFSHDENFHAMFVHNSPNKCDFVINCASAGTLREIAMKCVGAYGIFLDFSDKDMKENESFGMHYLFECKNYIAVDISKIFVTENYQEVKMLKERISEGIKKGIVKPLSRVVFSPNEVSAAFRLISTRKNMGKVLIQMTEIQNQTPFIETKTSIKTSNCMNEKTRFESGIGAFYTSLERNELIASEPIFTMTTRFNSTREKVLNTDPKATYLMMIPSFEGHQKIFTNIAERLKLRAITLQLSPDLKNTSVKDMAANLLKGIQKRYEVKSKFYIFGYSFGVNMALELAHLLEKEGLTGVVICLDSSPNALKTQLDAYLGRLTDIELQMAIIEYMYRLLTGRESNNLKEEMLECNDWSTKVSNLIEIVKNCISHSHDYIRLLTTSLYERMKVAREYIPDFKLESELVLIRGIPHPKSKGLTEDYDLSKYTTKPVKIFYIESDHALAPYDCRVANIINGTLDSQLLEEFNTKNLCDYYYKN